MAPKVGDAFELETPCGLAYFQVALDHPKYGPLIRVLPGLFEGRPDLDALIDGHDRFVAFYAATSALRMGLIRSVGSFSVPPSAAAFPLMKWPIGGDGHRYGWAIWDGRRELERRTALTEEQKAYPEPGVWNHALLLDNVASDWSWRDTAEPPPWRRPARPSGCDEPFSDELEDDPDADLTKHFLYFGQTAAAKQALRAVRETMGIARTDIHAADGSSQTLLLVRHASSVDPESLRSDFESIARRFDGEYDGWEAPVHRPGQ